MFCLAKFSPWKKNLETSLFEISCYQWNHGEAEDVTFIKSVSLLGTRREFTNMTKLSNLNQLYLIFLELSHFVELAFDHFVISCVQNCLNFSWICQSSCHPDYFKILLWSKKKANLFINCTFFIYSFKSISCSSKFLSKV